MNTEDVIAYRNLSGQLNNTDRNWWDSQKVRDIMTKMEDLFFQLDDDERNTVCHYQASPDRKR